MDTLIKECIEARAALQVAMKRSLDADEAANNAPLPANLRPATADDIKLGNILWHPVHAMQGNRAWIQIRKLLGSEDYPYLYVGHDGCKYDLTGACVEVGDGGAHEG